MICTRQPIFPRDQIKKNQMGGACDTFFFSTGGTHPGFWYARRTETDHLENPHRPTWEDNIKMGH